MMKLSAPQWIAAATTVLLLAWALWDLLQTGTAYQFILPILAVLYFPVLVIGAILKCILRRCNLHYDVYKQLILALWWILAGLLQIMSLNPIFAISGSLLCGFSLIPLSKAIELSIRHYQNHKSEPATDKTFDSF